MRKRKITLLDCITALGLLLILLFIYYGYKTKIFVSMEALHEFLETFGIFAALIFILIQAVQVVIPIIPGSVGCLAGVVVFGPVKGFIYNYTGICMGSMAAFLLARRYGMAMVEKMSKPELIKKYGAWLHSEKFDKWFAVAIFLPVAPDDFLCYLAGITKISFRKFTLIILAGKPLAIIAYSLGLNLIFTAFIQYIIPFFK